MGKKYVSMQEELAARKAAAGIGEPAGATINKKEPEKEALSAKFKGVLEKGTKKAKRQVRSRGQEGVPKIVEAKPEIEDLETIIGEPEETGIAQDAEWTDELEDDAGDDEGFFSLGEGENKGAGPIIVIVVAMAVFAIAFMLFDDDVDYEEDDTGWTYDSLAELSAESTDEEVIESVDEELEFVAETDSEALNSWIRETNIGKLMGKEIKYWNVSAGDKYLRVNLLFNEDEEYMTLCDEAGVRLQDALMDDDLDETRVLMIVRNQETRDLMYVSIDSDSYIY